MPAMSPENKGAPLARAMPKQSGKATKNTTTLAGRSDFICLNIEFCIVINFNTLLII
jgi:hypothetical protein